jgi:hypothetical protein
MIDKGKILGIVTDWQIGMDLGKSAPVLINAKKGLIFLGFSLV